MKRAKYLMVIGGGVFQVPCIKTAKEMGVKVVVTDYQDDAPGMLLADHPLVVSTRNINLTVNAAKEFHNACPLSGVMTVGTDASQTVAAVANALGLPGIPFAVAERATDKIKMRRCLKEAGVPVPDFRAVWSFEEAEKAMAELPFPIVVKPCDNMGARGVKKITKPEDLKTAFREAKEASVSGNIILEEYMDGPELSIDALVHNGQIEITGVADRIIEKPPYFVEMGHTMPSARPQFELDEAIDVFKSALRALGVTIGAGKGDIRLTSEGPKIVEVASRLSGGWMSAYTYPLSSGVNLYRAAIEIILGGKPSFLKPKKDWVSAERALIAEPGKILSIKGVDEAKKIKGVAEVILLKEPGDMVSEMKSNMGKVGYVITAAKDRQEAILINNMARETIRIETGPADDLTWDIIRNNARKKFYVACKACIVCDGHECAGRVPGIGGIGTGESFKVNLTALNKYMINLRTIHGVRSPNMTTELFGQTLSLPLLAAPITGMETNLGGGMSEEEYADSVINGCLDSSVIGMVGDGASPEKYRVGLQAIKNSGGMGIPVFKPRGDNAEIIKRFEAAQEAGVIAIGVDIDAASFKTMTMKKQTVGPKTLEDLKLLKSHLSVPFILKGIMNVETALLAIEAGADAIVVSNHGGRVMDFMPGTADVLPEIAAAVGGRVKVLVDGGIREGVDILKMLALGADAVMIGRPICIAAVGAGREGVRFFIEEKRKELKQAMILTGSADVKKVDPTVIVRKSKGAS